MDSSEWTKIESENGFPFYINKATGARQWDHPKFREIGQRLDDCNYVKYSVYRVALKFRVLQNVLYMDDVSLQIVLGVFDKHRLGTNESSLCLESCELEAVLYDIYFAYKKKNCANLDIDLATELMLNFLYNVFDPDRKGKLQVFSVKIILAILSNCNIKELFKSIFEECADHNNCVTRKRLHSFLSKIIDMMCYLHEESSYGSHLVSMAVENCFLKSPGFVGINETMFMSWVDSNPKIIYWIAIVYRIRIAESIVHVVKCKSCKTTSITGLCYRCTKCIRYNQCQKCFFMGKTTNSHKLSHSMREYCTPVESVPITIKMLKNLCSILQCKNEKDESSLIVIDNNKQFKIDKYCVVFNNTNELCNIKPMSSPKSQLRIVIKRLEAQNKELHQFLLKENLKEKEILRYLEEHKQHMAVHVDRLKHLKECISSNYHSPQVRVRKLTKKRMIESTPMVSNNCKSTRGENKISLDLLSPIMSVPETNSDKDDEKLYENQETSKSISDICDNGENTSVFYNIDDISTWIGGRPTIYSTTSSTGCMKPGLAKKATSNKFHTELDEALAQLQEILANNIGSEDSLNNYVDNTHLQFAMSEVEGMLTSFIDTVENTASASSAMGSKGNDRYFDKFALL